MDLVHADPWSQFRREPELSASRACLLACLRWRAARLLCCPCCPVLSCPVLAWPLLSAPHSGRAFARAPTSRRPAASCESAGCCGYLFCLGEGGRRLPAESGWFMRRLTVTLPRRVSNAWLERGKAGEIRLRSVGAGLPSVG